MELGAAGLELSEAPPFDLRRAADQLAGLPIAQTALEFALEPAPVSPEIDHARFIVLPIAVGAACVLGRDP